MITAHTTSTDPGARTGRGRALRLHAGAAALDRVVHDATLGPGSGDSQSPRVPPRQAPSPPSVGLGHGNTSMLAEPVLTGLADKHGRSVAQVLLRWHLQSGFVAIPKSTSPEHITENLDVFDLALIEADMAAIASSTPAGRTDACPAGCRGTFSPSSAPASSPAPP